MYAKKAYNKVVEALSFMESFRDDLQNSFGVEVFNALAPPF